MVTKAVSTSATVPLDRSIFVCRVALAVIRLPQDTEPMFVGPEARSYSERVEQALREALAADSRVLEVLPAEQAFDVDNARTRTFYDLSPDDENLLESMTAFQGLTLNSAILFRVRVPAKNQPRYRNLDDVPTDDYLVVWNGLVVAVQWRQGSPRATGSGGHIVLEILESAGRQAGYPVVVTACSPGCLHRFVHADFVTFRTGAGENFEVRGSTPVGSTIATPHGFQKDALSNLLRTYRTLTQTLHNFAEVKAQSDLLLYLADRARGDSADVLHEMYQRAARRRMPNIPGVIADLWGLRGSRLRVRRLIAGIWLALAMIDSRLGLFWRSHLHFTETMSSAGLVDIKEFFDVDEAGISKLDLSQVRASLQETASRLEGRILILATFAGAGAGLAGAALAALLTQG